VARLSLPFEVNPHLTGDPGVKDAAGRGGAIDRVRHAVATVGKELIGSKRVFRAVRVSIVGERLRPPAST
jgi:hypothetical protein